MSKDHPNHALTAGDAFVLLPPHLAVAIGEPSDDLEILEVALPAGFGTQIGWTSHRPKLSETRVRRPGGPLRCPSEGPTGSSTARRCVPGGG